MKRTYFLLLTLLACSFLFFSCSDDDDSGSCAESTWYQDNDGDGFGTDVSQTSCDQPDGFASETGDCNDDDATIFPGAPEDPNDGVDSACDGGDETIIWNGADFTFSKASNADWTDGANQDRITSLVTFTRQNNAQIYNYQWWQDQGLNDPSNNDLFANFWNAAGDQMFTPSGGTQGARWAILDDTGADNPWDASFDLFGTLGDSTHFYSFHNIATMIAELNDGNVPVAVPDDFNVEIANGTISDFTNMPQLVGKNLGVWLVEEDIYLTLSFTEWGSGNSGGALGYTRSTPQ